MTTSARPSRRRFLKTAAGLAAGLPLAHMVYAGDGQPRVKTIKPDGTPNRAAWMAQGSFGVMVHYLVHPRGSTPAEKTDDLNRIVDQFDVDFFLEQLDQAGADWLIFTLGQQSGYLSSRNEFIDQLEEGFTPRRDLVSEIAQQLHDRGKRLIIYLPGAHTPADPTVKRLLGRGTEGYADRHNAFIRDYSLKLGEACAGWWFDGCSPQAESVWLAEMDACRAGNPQSVVAFSGAEFCASGGQIRPVCPIADYHGGEIHLIEDGRIRTDLLWPPGEGIVISADGKLRKIEQPATFYMPDAQFIDNVQLHCLLPIDSTFNPAVPVQFCRYSDRELFQFVDGVKAVGGAVTLNVPIGGMEAAFGTSALGPAVEQPEAHGQKLDVQQGRIPQDSHAQLVRLRRHLGLG